MTKNRKIPISQEFYKIFLRFWNTISYGFEAKNQDLLNFTWKYERQGKFFFFSMYRASKTKIKVYMVYGM